MGDRTLYFMCKRKETEMILTILQTIGYLMAATAAFQRPCLLQVSSDAMKVYECGVFAWCAQGALISDPGVWCGECVCMCGVTSACTWFCSRLFSFGQFTSDMNLTSHINSHLHSRSAFIQFLQAMITDLGDPFHMMSQNCHGKLYSNCTFRL